jgi:uncharacterized membrane protein (DUF2068 family)
MSKHGFFESLRADLRLRTEPPDGVVRLIIAYKAISALVLLSVALLLLGIIVNHDFGQRVRTVVMLTGMRSDNHFLREGLLKLGVLGRGATTALGVLSLLYAVLESTEVFGLLNRRRWAEYLVLLATVFFLPYEGLEIVRLVTISKLAIFIINVAIAVYLVKRKRLFQHPDEHVARQQTDPRRAEAMAERTP